MVTKIRSFAVRIVEHILAILVVEPLKHPLKHPLLTAPVLVLLELTAKFMQLPTWVHWILAAVLVIITVGAIIIYLRTRKCSVITLKGTITGPDSKSVDLEIDICVFGKTLSAVVKCRSNKRKYHGNGPIYGNTHIIHFDADDFDKIDCGTMRIERNDDGKFDVKVTSVANGEGAIQSGAGQFTRVSVRDHRRRKHR